MLRKRAGLPSCQRSGDPDANDQCERRPATPVPSAAVVQAAVLGMRMSTSDASVRLGEPNLRVERGLIGIGQEGYDRCVETFAIFFVISLR